MIKFFLAAVRLIWKIGTAALVLHVAVFERFTHTNAVRYISFLWLVMFLDPGFWQSVWQFAGNIYAKLAHRRSGLENYACKGDYILPFTGKWTVFNGGVSRELSHSWGVMAQRYAYDFVILDGHSKTFSANSRDVRNYYCYGRDIIAPADGVVAKVSRRHENSRVTGWKAYCDTWDMRGNFIMIKHAGREYSVIAHLAPGSVSVRAGDKVAQGQVIAKCGNTGNSSEPHVHFQLQSGRSFFASAGLPIAFGDISARPQENYGRADPRPTDGNLRQEGSKFYIGRGLEVENNGIENEGINNGG